MYMELLAFSLTLAALGALSILCGRDSRDSGAAGWPFSKTRP